MRSIEGVMRHSPLLCAIVLLAAAAAYGQNAPPRFEVASIKPGGDEFSTRPERLHGRFRWTTQLMYLIGYAYRLDFSRVSCSNGGDTYVIEATFDPAATDDQVRSMVQSLLADRFKMRSHRVTTEADGYALSIGKGGPKVTEAKPPEAAPSATGDDSFIAAITPEAGVTEINAHRVPLSRLAETLHRVIGLPVWDRTGLSKDYDFAFRYRQDLSADVATDVPSLTAALQDDLGIRLHKEKGPVETLIVDSIEEPSGN